MDRIKNALVIQCLSSFVSNVMVIVLPLLMIEKNIRIETIGLIFAIFPIIFQSTRATFGILSDFLGRKVFFVTHGIVNIFYLLAYYSALTPLGFALGKVIEGVNSASLWAVNRPYLLDQTRNKRKALITMRSLSSVFSALGRLVGGFLIAWLFYSNTILFCVFISILILPNALVLKDKKRISLSIGRLLSYASLKEKSGTFKAFLLIFFFMGLVTGLVSDYVLPIFLKNVGISTELIGIILGINLLVSGMFTYFFTERLKPKKLILIGGAVYSLIVILLGVSGLLMVIILMMLLGAADGLVWAGQESIFVKITDHKSYGGDISLLMMGPHVGKMITQALSGFIIASYGFDLLFFVAGAVFLIYSFSAYKTLK